MEDKSQVVFVNAIEQAGFANGVYNVAFSTARFTPETDQEGNKKLSARSFVSANLRMDLFVAQQLYASLKEVLDSQTKPAAKSEMN